MQSIDPSTEEVVRDYPDTSDSDIAARLNQAETAYRSWCRVPFSHRAERFRSLAQLLRQDREVLAQLATKEMGKPIAASETEIDKCAWVCDYYAEHGEEFLAQREVQTGTRKSYVRYDALGVILAIMPWNFPYWQVFRFAVPALMAGNTAVLKHASNVPGVALAIEDLFRRAGFPEFAFTSLLISGSKVSRVIEHPAVRGVSLTGSAKAGRQVAEEAGRRLKKVVLELGGSDPFIVLGDAKVTEAAKLAVEARVVNSGQSCIAAKRFIVEQQIAGRFEEAFIAEMERLKVGDPMDRSVDVGPLARADLLDDLHQQVERSRASGAELRTGGRRLDRKGFFYTPTVLGNVRPGMAAFDEETFGPVAAIIRAENREEAIKLANQSPYGLGATICTEDLLLAEELAEDIECGMVFVNETVKSDPRLPFGGVKDSGYGRELGEEGIREFVNVKTVWIK